MTSGRTEADDGTMAGMVRVTFDLPEELAAGLAREASRRGLSEAELIRHALRRELEVTRSRPHGALFAGTEPIAERVDELLGESPGGCSG